MMDSSGPKQDSGSHAYWLQLEYGANAWWTTEFYFDGLSGRSLTGLLCERAFAGTPVSPVSHFAHMASVARTSKTGPARLHSCSGTGKLFERHCAECHGDNGDGSKRGPGLRSPDVWQAQPGALFWVLTNGIVRRGMPSWSKLPEPQRWQIVNFLQSIPLSPRPASPDRHPPQDR